MAYCGRPSKACANCRARRIKCNLLEPACSQCLRAGKVCSGYRDELSLNFRDENSKVIRKVHGRAHVPEQQKTRHCSAGTRNTPGAGPDPPWAAARSAETACPGSDLSIRILSLPLEDQGIAFFFRHYFTSSLHAQSTRLGTSVGLFWQDAFVQKPFLDAVSSVGLAGLANVKNNRQLMRVARLKHASTLHQVVTALHSPDNIDLSYTLRAIMMLALFDVVSYSPESASSWRVHLSGAIALMNSGRLRQFQDLVEVRMKMQFAFSVFVNCNDTGQKIPPPVAVWSRLWGTSLTQQDAPAASLANIAIQYVELYASIRAGILKIPGAIYKEALQLEVALKEWRGNLPAVWNYTVASTPGKSEVAFNGLHHVYQDFWIERMWDQYRWVRILVHELLLTHYETPSSSPEQILQQAESLRVISQLASDICSSVATVLYRLAAPHSTNSSSPRVGGIFAVLWTLRIAGGAIGVSDALHDWVIQMLENIGRTMGIFQTRVTISKAKEHRKRWKKRFSIPFDNALDDFTRDIDALSVFTDLD